ncbi:NADPH-dependent FMN reductase [Peribacillus huizhouensis]|uniref:NAD(P)H-dependent FMN reductase n=1 Tax=Peribacillus huizhouensis TaxID=1501239 RepID=A0ABR6CP94_9BACI|nr:NADPH-dependent FMN reductase [Peribacillus huizhouensis]MBA9026864.1 NAD(P)H-dependent FMN reductase [Peribacillus huizhouensis]
MKLLGISGALIGTKTAVAVNEVLTQASQHPHIETELLDLKDYKVEFVDGRSFDAYNEDTRTVINKILQADFFVIATPVYQSSLTGALKNLFDHLPTTVFEGKVVGYVSTAGSNMHMLVAENHLRPILSYFKAHVATRNVFVSNECFNKENVIENDDVKHRLADLAEELVVLHTKLNG